MNKPSSSPDSWWDLPAAMLLLAALLTATTRLVATRWTAYLSVTQTITFFGILIGLALGKSRFSPRLVALLAIVYGAFMVPWQLGNTLKPGMQWTERLIVLLNRLVLIIFQIAHDEVIQDSLLFLVLMFMLFGALSVHAGFTLVRYGDAWKAIIPSGLALFVIHAFDPLVSRRAWYLAVYLFFALVLVARVVYLHRQSRWQKSRTALPPHLGLDFIRFTVLASGVIVLFAWTAPALANALPAAQKAWQPVQRTWNNLRNQFDNAFASLRPSVGTVSAYYGSSSSLGRGTPKSDTLVFTVKPPSNLPSNLRFYWRAKTYDTYDNGQWFDNINRVYSFDPRKSELPFPQEIGRWLGSFDFISATNLATLFAPPQPLWVNRQSQVEYAQNPDGTVDLSSFRASPSLDSGQVYTAQSSLSNPTIAQLAGAGVDYPTWITERYLSLPDSITPRTRQLAQQITAGLDTPYQKVTAITSYLRANITYVETIEINIPARQEAIDWFLFDLKKGFCNYYSTAEIVLLRSLGIPARWAVGYARGEPQADGSYIVRQRDAHSWPEVYFPGIGWVEFEPTASQPTIDRLSGENQGSAYPNPNSDLADFQRRAMEEEMAQLRAERNRSGQTTTQQKQMNVVYWIVPLVLGSSVLFLILRKRPLTSLQHAPILLEAALMKVGIKPPKLLQLWARRAALPPLSKAYLEINHALARLGNPPVITDTPTERATTLGQLIPPADNAAHTLVNEYQIETFGKQPANLVVALKAAAEIKSQSYKAFLQRLFSRLQRPARGTH
jgi:transglutaminase-like putative cysteine protease